MSVGHTSRDADPHICLAIAKEGEVLRDWRRRAEAAEVRLKRIADLEPDRAKWQALAREYSVDYANGYEAAAIEARIIAEG